MARRCFVISPIGEEGSEIREHADDVFDFIIKPAMDELGFTAHRADHTNEVGRITDQMYRAILHDDLRIAILTFRNPNVFYELAVAQAAAKPTILMMLKGSSMPFDVSDMRAVEYDLKPRPLRDRIYQNKIIEHVRSLESSHWRVAIPFGTDLSPLGGAVSDMQTYDKAEDFGRSDAWLNMLRNTCHRFSACGISLHAWTRFGGLKDLIAEKAEAGCQIRLLLLDPENPALPQYLNEEHAPGRVAEGINRALQFFNNLAKAHPNVTTRTVRHGSMHQQIVATDTKTVVIPYLFGRATFQSPLIELKNEASLAKVMQAEFDGLWAANEPAHHGEALGVLSAPRQ